jgi:hypothetical protein
MQGATPAEAVLDFTWDQCGIAGDTFHCSIEDMTDVSVAIGEPSGDGWRDSTITNTSRGETFQACAATFNCTWYSDPDVVPHGSVTASMTSGADPVATIDETLNMEGTGCRTEFQWVAEYTITVPAGGLESDIP